MKTGFRASCLCQALEFRGGTHAGLQDSIGIKDSEQTSKVFRMMQLGATISYSAVNFSDKLIDAHPDRHAYRYRPIVRSLRKERDRICIDDAQQYLLRLNDGAILSIH
jgi:hypothetical protein